MTYDNPCPHCGELGHEIIEWRGELILNCPKIETGTLKSIGGTIIRDNRAQFKPKKESSSEEFPEFSDALDFFDAHTIID